MRKATTRENSIYRHPEVGEGGEALDDVDAAVICNWPSPLVRAVARIEDLAGRVGRI